jgi:hypothetical protein
LNFYGGFLIIALLVSAAVVSLRAAWARVAVTDAWLLKLWDQDSVPDYTVDKN